MVAAGEGLSGKGAEELGKRARVFQPGLKVATAGLDDGARIESVCGEPDQRWLVEVIEDGEAVFAGRTEVDVRAEEIVAHEQGKPVEHGRGSKGVEAGEHLLGAEYAEIVERGLDGGEDIGNGGLNPVHGGDLSRDVVEAKGGGSQGRELDPARPPGRRAGSRDGPRVQPPLLESLNATAETAPALLSGSEVQWNGKPG